MIRQLLYALAAVVLLVFTSHTISAQATHNHAQCGVGLQDGQAIKNRMLQNRREQAELLSAFEKGRGNDSTVWVPLQFHIVTKTDGTDGESIRDILDNMCRLNQDYLHLNVEFYLAGPIRYVAQDLLYTNDFGAVGSFYMQMYKQNGVVNIFVGDDIQSGISGGTTLGYYTSNIDVIYAIRAAVNGSSSTLTHELGHFFSLPHTFFGWEGQDYESVMTNTTGRTPSSLPSGFPVENIIRSGGTENCQVAGDAFCDTEANYLFGFFGSKYNTNGGCDYASTAHDPLGVLFDPSVIAANPLKFSMEEGNPNLKSLFLTNASVKNQRIHPKTLIVVETEFTNNGTTTLMWQDTIGDSDSTDIYVNHHSSDNIIDGGVFDVQDSFITMGNYALDINLSSSNADLSFYSTTALFTVAVAGHETFFDSLTVTNTSATNTVAAGTIINIEEIFNNGGTQVNSETWTVSLPNALAPGQSYSFTFQGSGYKSTIGGVTFSIKTYAPSQTYTNPTSTNIMSYYGDGCVTGFSHEQGDAMKADIASRGFATLYSEPTDALLTSQVSVNNPVAGAVSPYTLMQFRWDAISDATMYHVVIYERNTIIGGPLVGGISYERMVTTNDMWITLANQKNYGWTITPINPINFCDPSLTSPEIAFQVVEYVGVEQIAKNKITSSNIYPNPVKSNKEIVLEINAAQDMEATIAIYNTLGQSMMTNQSLSLTAGTNVQRLNTASLTTGLYLVTIKTKDGIISHKLQIED